MIRIVSAGILICARFNQSEYNLIYAEQIE